MRERSGMTPEEEKRLSKFLSLLLRHRPEAAGLTLDQSGWVKVDSLLAGMHGRGEKITKDDLVVIVSNNDKQRFQLSDDQTRIRATQGHSVNIELGYESAVPPPVLLHGTPEKFVQSIRTQGLLKQKRHHVHLHQDEKLAKAVGERRGKAVILKVDALRMNTDGHEFYVTPNNVWLTDCVPPAYISFPATNEASFTAQS